MTTKSIFVSVVIIAVAFNSFVFGDDVNQPMPESSLAGPPERAILGVNAAKLLKDAKVKTAEEALQIAKKAYEAKMSELPEGESNHLAEYTSDVSLEWLRFIHDDRRFTKRAGSVWEIRFRMLNGDLHGIVWVHPETGEVNFLTGAWENYGDGEAAEKNSPIKKVIRSVPEKLLPDKTSESEERFHGMSDKVIMAVVRSKDATLKDARIATMQDAFQVTHAIYPYASGTERIVRPDKHQRDIEIGVIKKSDEFTVERLGYPVPGFAEKGDTVWEIRPRDFGGLRSMLWLHPVSGKMCFVAGPWERWKDFK